VIGKDQKPLQIVEQIEKGPSLVDRAYETIRRALVSGRIPPGDWLRQEILAQELGVSPRTVREALKQLVTEGLAVHEPYRGVRTIAPSFEEIEEIYQIRAMLEGWAVELAANRLSPQELAQMRALLPRTGQDPKPASLQESREVNREFHWIPIRATKQKHLTRLLEQLWDFVLPHIWGETVAVEETVQSDKNYQEHRQLLEALETSEGSQARELITKHILRQLDALRAIKERI